MSGINGIGSALRAPPTGNPYAPPVTMMRPQQGYQPQSNAPQAPQGDYTYRPQNIAPVQHAQQQPWAMPQLALPTAAYQQQQMSQHTDPSAPGYDSEAAFAAQSGWGSG